MTTKETSQAQVIQKASERLAAEFGGTADEWADDLEALGPDNVSTSLRMLHVEPQVGSSKWGRFVKKARLDVLGSKLSAPIEWLRARDLLPP